VKEKIWQHCTLQTSGDAVNHQTP